MRNQLSHVKANPAGTNHRHFLTNRLVTSNRINIAHDLLMIDTGDIGGARANPCCHNHMIKTGIGQRLCIHLLAQAHCHLVLSHHGAVIANRFVKFLLTRHLFREIKLPTNLIGSII